MVSKFTPPGPGMVSKVTHQARPVRAWSVSLHRQGMVSNTPARPGHGQVYTARQGHGQ